MHHVTSNLLAILAGSSSLTTKEGHQKILDSMGIDGSTRSSGVSKLANVPTGRAVAVFTARDLQLLLQVRPQGRAEKKAESEQSVDDLFD
ncbi:large ribosomal subunit protein P2-like [Ovis aries]|uniref:large ribosomal subunit protein P2-like n=1 Tax=Ovis aries TaxID=9940 RepID=UPI0005FB98E3|nr:large ribosomal subunit protein P2-like [Ovis aries]